MEGPEVATRGRSTLGARALAAGALVAIVTIAACDHYDPDHGIRSPSDNFLPRTTPANLLHNLRWAYQERSIAE